MASDQPVYHDERVRAAADAREQLLKYDRPMSKADEERAVEELSQTVLTLSAEVARLRAELEHERDVLSFTAAQHGLTERENRRLREDLDRALDALRALVPLHKTRDEWHAYTAARAVLAAHDREANDG